MTGVSPAACTRRAIHPRNCPLLSRLSSSTIWACSPPTSPPVEPLCSLTGVRGNPAQQSAGIDRRRVPRRSRFREGLSKRGHSTGCVPLPPPGTCSSGPSSRLETLPVGSALLSMRWYPPSCFAVIRSRRQGRTGLGSCGRHALHAEVHGRNEVNSRVVERLLVGWFDPALGGGWSWTRV